MKFTAILALIAAVAAVEVCDANNKAGNPLCDQEKEIETSSDRKWKKLKRSQKVVRVTKRENKAKQARETRKEREGQLKARAAARAIRNYVEEQQRNQGRTLVHKHTPKQALKQVAKHTAHKAAPAKEESSSSSSDEAQKKLVQRRRKAAPAKDESSSSSSNDEAPKKLAQAGEDEFLDDVEENLHANENFSDDE